MPVYKLATSVWFDSTLPRDAEMINPVVNDKGITSNPTNLATDWLNALKSWAGWPNGYCQRQCKVYDLEAPKPNYPVATVIQDLGVAGASAYPREIACCLSFYAGQNEKRKRGRLYIPAHWFASALANRPDSTQRTKVGALATALASLGGADVDWCVWSKVDGQERQVSNWWVDDEWDVQRRRGLKSTAKTQGGTSGREAGQVGALADPE